MIGQKLPNQPDSHFLGTKVSSNKTNKMTMDVKNMNVKEENKMMIYNINKIDDIMTINSKAAGSSNRAIKPQANSLEINAKAEAKKPQSIKEKKSEIKSPIKYERVSKQINQSKTSFERKTPPNNNFQTTTKEIKQKNSFTKSGTLNTEHEKKGTQKFQSGNKEVNKRVTTMKFQAGIKEVQQRTAVKTQALKEETEMRKSTSKSNGREAKQNNTDAKLQIADQEIKQRSKVHKSSSINEDINQKKGTARLLTSIEKNHKSNIVIKSQTIKGKTDEREDILKPQKQGTKTTKIATNSQTFKKEINKNMSLVKTLDNEDDLTLSGNTLNFPTYKEKINQTKDIMETSVYEEEVTEEESTGHLGEMKKIQQDITSFGKTNRLRLEKIRDDFNNKGNIGLTLDSKVPEYLRHSWWYSNMVTFKRSDKVKVLQEIEEHINLHKRIEDFNSLTFEELEEMQSTLQIASERAKVRTMTTNSSTIFDICKEFVSSQIVNKFEKIKCDVALHEYKTLRNKLKQTIEKEVNKYSQEFKKERDKHQKEIKREALENERKIEFYQKIIQDYDKRLNALENGCTEYQ